MRGAPTPASGALRASGAAVSRPQGDRDKQCGQKGATGGRLGAARATDSRRPRAAARAPGERLRAPRGRGLRARARGAGSGGLAPPPAGGWGGATRGPRLARFPVDALVRRGRWCPAGIRRGRGGVTWVRPDRRGGGARARPPLARGTRVGGWGGSRRVDPGGPAIRATRPALGLCARGQSVFARGASLTVREGRGGVGGRSLARGWRGTARRASRRRTPRRCASPLPLSPAPRPAPLAPAHPRLLTPPRLAPAGGAGGTPARHLPIRGPPLDSALRAAGIRGLAAGGSWASWGLGR